MLKLLRSVLKPILHLVQKVKTIDSPVLVREMRARMRGSRVFIATGIYVTVLGLITGALIITAVTSANTTTGIHWQQYAQLGHNIVRILAVVQLALVVIFSPGLTCASFSSEVEQRTFEAVALTTISSRTIVLGKFAASLCYLALLLLCSLPILALTFLFGGVSPMEIILVYLTCLATGLFFGALGLLASAMVKRTFISTGLAYGFMLFWLIGLPASTFSSFGMFLFGGLTIAGLLATAARWLLPRIRKGWQPERVVYLATFGFSYCAIAAMIHVPGLTDAIDKFLERSLGALNPFALVGLPPYGSSSMASSSGSIFISALLFIGFTTAGTIAALLGTLSIIRAMRAPVADSLEVEERVARELSNPLSTGEAV